MSDTNNAVWTEADEQELTNLYLEREEFLKMFCGSHYNIPFRKRDEWNEIQGKIEAAFAKRRAAGVGVQE